MGGLEGVGWMVLVELLGGVAFSSNNWRSSELSKDIIW